MATAAQAQCDTLLDADFDHWDDRRYSIADAKSDFGGQVKPWTASTYRGIEGPGADPSLIEDTPQETRVVDGTLRAEYKANDASGRSGGFLFDPYFDGVEEAYLTYKLKFDRDFFWATGGKLPGLGGSTRGVGSETEGRGAIPSGCQYNEDGFSARLMWRRNRAQTDDPYLILYSYFAEKPDGTPRKETGDCGDNYRIYTGLEPDTWYTITQYVRLNTPGVRDGVVAMWIDGEETFRKEDFLIRKAGRGDVQINALVMNTYRGGSRTDPVWHSPRDEFAFFDDFRVWTGDLGCVGLNAKPDVRIVRPQPNARYAIGDSVVVEAEASDADGAVAAVRLFVNDSLVRELAAPPYRWGGAGTGDALLYDLPEGVYRLRAVAEDDERSTDVQEITITVGDASAAPAASFLTPADGAVYEAGDSIVVEVAASDPDGTIDHVALYLDGVFLRQERVTPYEWGHRDDLDPELKEMAPGTYELLAVAQDNDGLTDSTSISVTVREVSAAAEARVGEVRVWPSPARETVTVRVPPALVGERCSLYDATGRRLRTLALSGEVTEVSVGRLPAGVYVVRVGAVGVRLVRG